MMPGLGRLISFDERSRSFPIRTLVAGKPLRSYTWSCPVRLDQGQDGSCVGFGWTHELAAHPVVVPGQTNELALGRYRSAQRLDARPGEAYVGTSVLAGAKAVRAEGFMTEYRWAFGLDDLLLAVGYTGPVVIGIPWYESMLKPDATGFLRVSGDVAGGHCTLVNRVNVGGRFVGIVNSWGPTWGANGTALISFDDLDRLLHEQGEACVPVGRRRSAA